jgi:hypothetical protein
MAVDIERTETASLEFSIKSGSVPEMLEAAKQAVIKAEAEGWRMVFLSGGPNLDEVPSFFIGMERAS